MPAEARASDCRPGKGGTALFQRRKLFSERLVFCASRRVVAGRTSA